MASSWVRLWRLGLSVLVVTIWNCLMVLILLVAGWERRRSLRIAFNKLLHAGNGRFPAGIADVMDLFSDGGWPDQHRERAARDLAGNALGDLLQFESHGVVIHRIFRLG